MGVHGLSKPLILPLGLPKTSHGKTLRIWTWKAIMEVLTWQSMRASRVDSVKENAINCYLDALYAPSKPSSVNMPFIFPGTQAIIRKNLTCLYLNVQVPPPLPHSLDGFFRHTSPTIDFPKFPAVFFLDPTLF
jgi:hypothetical protein